MDFSEYARAIAARPDLPRPICNLVTVLQTESTHLLGRRIVEEYGREGLRAPGVDVIAWTQTGGIGRDGHEWSSPPGKGVYLTAMRALESTERIQLLPLAISVSLCATIDRWLRSPDSENQGPEEEPTCRLKWPNDLFVDDRKLGGILIDVVSPGAPPTPEGGSKPLASLSSAAAARKARKPIAILSVGVNVDRDLAVFEHSRATSVDVEAEQRGRATVPLATAACELIDALDAGVSVESPRLLDEYRRFSRHRPGDQMQCRVDSETVSGTFLGFDRQGFLILQVDGEERRISSGVIVDEA